MATILYAVGDGRLRRCEMISHLGEPFPVCAEMTLVRGTAIPSPPEARIWPNRLAE